MRLELRRLQRNECEILQGMRRQIALCACCSRFVVGRQGAASWI